MQPAHKKMPTAHSLEEAANSDNSLEGYASINGENESSEIARLAYKFYEERGGVAGSPEEDWFRAEERVRAARRLGNVVGADSVSEP